jgi:hypothetical protein
MSQWTRAEQVGADPRQAVHQVAEPARAAQQLAHHQQRPAASDHIQRLRQRAVLTVTSLHFRKRKQPFGEAREVARSD